MSMLHKIRVVLVNTSHPGNIGGAARAMKNMGLSKLVLVDPVSFPSPEADARASGATDILAAAQVVATLEQALVGCSLVMGTSARERAIPWPLLDPRESGQKCLEGIERGEEVALVFGREHSGLTNEELSRCHYHVNIPSDPNFASLNLATAVQVLTYEARMAWLSAQGQPTKLVSQDPDAIPVTADELEQYFAHLEATLIEIGFLIPQRPRHLMARLRKLYSRSGVTKLEMNILRGILTETQKTVRGDAHKRSGQ